MPSIYKWELYDSLSNFLVNFFYFLFILYLTFQKFSNFTSYFLLGPSSSFSSFYFCWAQRAPPRLASGPYEKATSRISIATLCYSAIDILYITHVNFSDKYEKFNRSFRKIYQKIFRIYQKIFRIQKNLSEKFIRKFFLFYYVSYLSYLAQTPFFFLFLVSWLALPSGSVSGSVGKRKQAEIYLAYRIYTFIFLYVFYIDPHCKNHIPSL